MIPDSINNSMWFLFTNELQDSFENSDKATQAKDSFWRMVKRNKRLCQFFLPRELFEWRGNK